MIFTKKKRSKNRISSKYWLLIAVAFCVSAMLGTVAYNINGGPLYTIASTIFVPMQNGINQIGLHLSNFSENRKTKAELIAENEELKNQVDELTSELNSVVLDVYELDQLRSLYDIDNLYSDYDKVGAYVISMDAGNWFHSFTINKGSEDGIAVNMNVLSGAGLVGIVTEVGPHSATVRSIIDDDCNVSAMVLTSSDRMIVSGSLDLMDQSQKINFSQLRDDDNEDFPGASVVTSYISDKYLPGLLIGYISEISMDSNNLTKSGTITPAVDFAHLTEVLVITDLKQTAD